MKVRKIVRQRRIKVAGRYLASGHGRGINTQNVYFIDGKCYTYHPEYAKQDHIYKPLEGELKGYIRVNHIYPHTFHHISGSDIDPHKSYRLSEVLGVTE